MLDIKINKLTRYLAGFIFIISMLSPLAHAFDASAGLKELEEANIAKKLLLAGESKDKKTETLASASNDVTGAENVQLGKSLYGNTCLFCHGPSGVGSRAPNLTEGHWAPGGANDDDYMMKIIKNGRENTIMGSFKDTYTEKEISSIIAYLRFEAKKVAVMASK